MSNQNLSQIIAQALLHSGLIIGGCIILFIALVVICKLLARWRNAAVRRALSAEFERQFEAQILANIAEGEKRYGLQLALHSVWDEVNALYYALHGTTRQMEDDLWELSKLFGMPMPQMVLPEIHRPFLVELTALTRGLTHLGTQIDNARAEREDLDVYSKWVEELWARYRLFELQHNNEQRRLQDNVAELRKLYEEIGKLYYMARFNSSYQGFSGMLHIVELMVDEGRIANKELKAYVAALAKQLAMLVVSFEKGVREDDAWVWIGSIGKCPTLEALVASFEQSKF